MTEFPITVVPRGFSRRQYSKLCARATQNSRGCIIPKRAPNKDGYVRWTVTKGQRARFSIPGQGELNYYVHQLAWYCKTGTIPERNVEHLSHLCSDSRCMNADHLTVESPQANNSRKNCIVQCPCCKFILCKHEPRCIPK